ncbi:Ser/Thr protein phosphatase protein [Calocera viscosa TUFC12733]|uniref:Ser/Thr protein phosphatase protein n=1 Tax=Calocera viscosa (strain TUFC12733) TaxID=1330018 RepID=A0A167KDU9_CALVF|nr:Ser/Thr protein phosphatase protein [Calocera viscosa TUFC12733]
MGNRLSRRLKTQAPPSGEIDAVIHIQLMSDVHLETSQYEFDFPVAAENLALLGDIGNTVDDALFKWLDVQLKQFERVFFLAGNHEAYRSNLADSRRRLQRYADRNDRFIYLNRTRYDMSPTLTILGCTLWSALDPKYVSHIYMGLSDFRQISDFGTAAYAKEHRRDLDWLVKTIQDIRSKEPLRHLVVFTHHTPTFDGTSSPRYEGSMAGSAFSTELTNKAWWGAPLVLWAFGHTHYSCDFTIKGVRLVSNQKGYFRDRAEGFIEEKVLELR